LFIETPCTSVQGQVVKCQGHNIKRRLIAKLSLSFEKSRSLNLMAMSEFRLEARKQQFVRVGGTNLAENSPERLTRRRAAFKLQCIRNGHVF